MNPTALVLSPILYSLLVGVLGAQLPRGDGARAPGTAESPATERQGTSRQGPSRQGPSRQGPSRQGPSRQGPGRRVAHPQQSDWVEIAEHSEERSRAAFRACDRNADDRLSIFEAGRALRSFGNPRDAAAFRRVDVNTDGHLEWPEFDRRFREIVNAGGSLHLRPYRPTMLAKPAANTSPAPSKAKRLHDLLDRDDDGKVTVAEFKGFAVALGSLGVKGAKSMTDLDADGSKTLEPVELTKFAEALPERLLGPEPTGDDKSRLPPGYRAADRNRDGVLDATELRSALQRIDPVLGRWAEVILRNADISKNGALGRLEIESAQRQGASSPDAARRGPDQKK